MAKIWRFIFILLLCIFTLHLIRDILQIFEVHNILTDIDLVYRPHKWCAPYCDYVSIPPEIFGIIGSIIVLKRKRIDVLGVLILISLILWPFMVYLP